MDHVDLGIEGFARATVIGSGGFGRVYAATEIDFDRLVAIKVLTNLDEAGRRRFERERVSMGRLDRHPNVVTPYRSGYTSDGSPFLVMELMGGGSLQDRLTASGPLQWDEAAHLLLPIADALGHGHDNGVLHRDVKPENILLTANGVPKLTDYGISAVREHTATAAIGFTMGHAPPETFAGGVDQRDERSDLYSLASTLFALVTGRTPYATTQDNDSQLAHIMRIAQDPVPSLGHPVRDAFLASALAKDPSHRPPDAATFAHQLSGTLAPTIASPPTPATPQAATPTEVAQPHPDPQEPRPAPTYIPPVAPSPSPSSPLARPGADSGPGARQFSSGPSPASPLARPGADSGPGARQFSSSPSPASPPRASGRARLGLVLAAVVVVVAAAGGWWWANRDIDAGDDQVGPSDLPADEGDTATEDPDDPTAGTGSRLQPGDATSMAQLEEAWAQARAGVVATIVDGGHGVGADNILRGPGGFTVDLSQCPTSWQDDAGVGGQISLAYTTALSGNLAQFGAISDGMQAYIAQVNASGGIDGRDVELTVLDDGYVATETITLVDELLSADSQPLAITNLGSPPALAVHDTLNEACVPQPFVQSGHPAFGDPQGHPFTTGLQLAYNTEAIMWGHWIDQEVATGGPVKVAALVMDNDLGLALSDAFEQWAAANPAAVSAFVPIRHDPASGDISPELNTIVAEQADVVIAMTAGNPCVQAVTLAADLGLDPSSQPLLLPSFCRLVIQLSEVDVADGWRSVSSGFRLDSTGPGDDSVFSRFAIDELEEAGVEPSPEAIVGFAVYGRAHVEALRIAADLPGGLTRSNLVLALRSMDLTHPGLLDGMTFSTSGNDDAYFIEGSRIEVFRAATNRWEADSPLYEVNGSTPNCPFDSQRC